MISSRTRNATASAAAVLTFALVAGGCGSDDGGAEAAASTPSAPVATGTGPYPTPSVTGADTAEPTPPASPGTPRGGSVRPKDVDLTDADAVSEGAITALWTFDTTVDQGPHDAELRTAEAGWLTDAYADRLRARPPRPVSGAQWQEWADHDARTTVAADKTEDAARPPDGDTEAWRQWTVTATPSGSKGWVGDPVVVAVYAQLTRAAPGKPWRVADVTVR
ncbi:hypothetical protein [Streptomyces sp. NPDC049970]|uniref:hypothetical protein n=1 Tax=Streptomyces sp. NPDC049970 TaxID=3155033 RepID=UPI003426028D